MKKMILIVVVGFMAFTFSRQADAAEELQCGVNVDCFNIQSVYAFAQQAYRKISYSSDIQVSSYASACLRNIQQIEKLLPYPQAWSAQDAETYTSLCNDALRMMR